MATQKIVQFPSSGRKRRKILRQSEDKRVRAAAFLRSLFGWLFVLTVVLFSIEHFSLFAPESIRRMMGYAAAGLQTREGDNSVITYAGGTMTDAEKYGVGLAYVDSDTLYVSGTGGLNQLNYQHSYGAPVVETSEQMILVYDRGGKSAMLANALAPVTSIKVDSPILSGAIGKNGGFTLVCDETGYKTSVVAFDDRAKQVFKWSTSEYNIMSAALSPDGKDLCALAFKQNGVTIESHVLYFTFGKDTVTADVNLGDALGYEIRYLTSNVAAAVTDNGLFLVSDNGDATRVSAYSAEELTGFAFDGDRLALATRSYAGEARSEIRLIDAKKVSAPITITGEITSFDFAGDRIGVLSTAGLSLYDAEGALLNAQSVTSGARRVLMKSDGTAILLYAKNAACVNLVK